MGTIIRLATMGSASPYFPLPIFGEFLGPRRFLLHAPFVYIDPEMDIEVEVPAGFVTDFNSVPRAFWWYFAPHDVLEAGVVHDWLYHHPGGFESASLVPPLDRHQIDDLHRRILHLMGMRWSKRQVVRLVLRSAGWAAWDNHRALDPVSNHGAADKTAPFIEPPASDTSETGPS